MTTEITKIDPKEFGLSEVEVQTIESAFMPKIVERDGLKQVYEELITKEITPELCREAKTVRLKLVKVRTGIADIHKTQKAFFLAAGRFVDAWKNKETLPVTQMEENLQAIEEHYDRIEADRIAKLQEERAAELRKYQDETAFIPGNLGELTEQVWANYLLGVKTAYEQKIAAEKAAAEAEAARIEAEKAEQERIRVENERLKKEVEEQKKVRETRNTQLRPYIIFIRDYEKMINLPEEEYQKELSEVKIGAEQHWEFERQEQIKNAKANAEREEKVRKEREAHEAELKAERDKAEAARKELEAKAEAERKAAEEKERMEQAELSKGDADKILDLIVDLKALAGKYQFKAKKNQKLYANVGLLLDKVVNYINENQ